MTDKMPDDSELEQYLKGDSKLSQLYREASREGAAPQLDEAILAQARASVRPKPGGLNRYLAPVALAASLVLGVNLAWNLYEAEPMPPALKKELSSRDDRVAAAPAPATPAPEPMPAESAPAPAQPRANAPAAAPERKAERKPEPFPAQEDDALRQRMQFEENLPAAKEQAAQDQAAAESRESVARAEAERSAKMKTRSMAQEQGAAAGMAAPAAAPAMADAAAPLTESQKIDTLIRYIGALDGAVFIRNGKEYGPAEAAKHLQLKRDKAGDRVRTADDFIRLCASHSYVSGEAYLIRFPDGRTRTAEDVLREELARLR